MNHYVIIVTRMMGIATMTSFTYLMPVYLGGPRCCAPCYIARERATLGLMRLRMAAEQSP